MLLGGTLELPWPELPFGRNNSSSKGDDPNGMIQDYLEKDYKILYNSLLDLNT
jgi:hypothetical protein